MHGATTAARQGLTSHRLARLLWRGGEWRGWYQHSTHWKGEMMAHALSSNERAVAILAEVLVEDVRQRYDVDGHEFTCPVMAALSFAIERWRDAEDQAVVNGKGK